MRQHSSLARLLASAAVTAILAAGPGRLPDHVRYYGIADDKTEPNPETDRAGRWKSMASAIAPIPRIPVPRLAYGQALRATGQRAQAVAVLEQASIANPGNKPVLAGYGRALADNGNFQAAFDMLSHAQSPIIPTGGFYRCRERYSISLAGMTKRAPITPAR